MASSSSDFDVKYCSLCDQYFISKQLLQQHIQGSNQHPRCTTCKRNYLNMNSLRNHYVLSSRHHYCRACEKSFKTAAGLRVHLEQAAFHKNDDDDDDDYSDDDKPDGWEDEVARLENYAERLRQTEDEIFADDEEESRLSRIQRRIGVLKLKTRTPTPLRLQQHCPICLENSKNTSATRCGHLFCTSCIENALDKSGICPTCRNPCVLSHLRNIDLQMY